MTAATPLVDQKDGVGGLLPEFDHPKYNCMSLTALNSCKHVLSLNPHLEELMAFEVHQQSSAEDTTIQPFVKVVKVARCTKPGKWRIVVIWHDPTARRITKTTGDFDDIIRRIAQE